LKLNAFIKEMKVYCVSSFNEIKEIANDCNFLAKDGILFRGTSQTLLPSITEKCSFFSYADLVVKEHLLLNDFIKYSHIKYEFNAKIARDWEIRIAAREHGLASSLMDWSNSLEIATEFAIYDFEAKNIDYTNLWILKKSKMDQILISKELEKKDSFQEIINPTIAQYAKFSNSAYWRRKFIQGGFFLKQPYQDIKTSLENNPFFAELLIHIIIPRNVIPEIWQRIASKYNLDEDVCPSNNNSDKALDKICAELNSKYK